MDEIRRRPGFLPEATWLVLGPAGWCGTVQGVRHAEGVGMVMNLGVVPRYRGRGIGTALLLQALHGFRRRGLGRAQLEVTAENQSAVRLYLQLGFRCRKTLYKAVDSSLQPSAAKMSNAALTPPALACAQLDSEHSFP
jgi:ribosomal protein S18 acetylase RimI-like enzyme